MNQGISFKDSLISWLTLLRVGASARGVLPFLLGATIAWSKGYPINWSILALSTIAVLCIMLMTFLINDYYDYEADSANVEFHRLSGGSRVLPMGVIPRSHAAIAAHVFLLLAGVFGLLLQFYYSPGPFTLILGVVAILIGYF